MTLRRLLHNSQTALTGFSRQVQKSGVSGPQFFLLVQIGVAKGSIEETCLQQQAQVWELVSVLYSEIGREAPLARRLEGKPPTPSFPPLKSRGISASSQTSICRYVWQCP